MRYFFIIFFLNSCFNSNNKIHNYDYDLMEFRLQIQNRVNIGAIKNKEDAIQSIKLYNTLLYYNLNKDTLYKIYVDYFERNKKIVTTILRCGYGLGMTTVCEDSLNIGSYYSRKSIYKLNIEPPDDGRERILKDSPSMFVAPESTK